MKAGWKFALALLVALAGLPLAASAGHGHRHHGGGGYGYGGDCCCGAQVQYAPPAHAQYGQPTPAGVAGGAGYQSFSYSPAPAGEIDATTAAAAPIVSGPGYYQPQASYAPNYYGGYGGYSSHRREARAYNNVVNKSLGNHDYGVGRW